MLTVIGMIESEWWGWAYEREEEFSIGYNHTSRMLKTISWEDTLPFNGMRGRAIGKEIGPDPPLTRLDEKEVSSSEKTKQLIEEFGG